MDKKQQPHYIINGNYMDYTFSGTYHTDLIIYLYEGASECISLHSQSSKLYSRWKFYISKAQVISSLYLSIENVIYDKSNDVFITLNIDKLYNNDMSAHPHILLFYKWYDLDGYTLYTSYGKKIKIHTIDNRIIVSFTDINFDTKIFICNILQQRRLFK